MGKNKKDNNHDPSSPTAPKQFESLDEIPGFAGKSIKEIIDGAVKAGVVEWVDPEDQKKKSIRQREERR